MADNPETRLIVYGSLAPGGANAFRLADLVGEWHPCTIRGHLGRYRGFKSFRYDPRGRSSRHGSWNPPNFPGFFLTWTTSKGKNMSAPSFPSK